MSSLPSTNCGNNSKKLHKNRYHSLFFSCLILLDLFNFTEFFVQCCRRKTLEKVFFHLSLMKRLLCSYSKKFIGVLSLNYKMMEKGTYQSICLNRWLQLNINRYGNLKQLVTLVTQFVYARNYYE